MSYVYRTIFGILTFEYVTAKLVAMTRDLKHKLKDLIFSRRKRYSNQSHKLQLQDAKSVYAAQQSLMVFGKQVSSFSVVCV